MSKRGSRRADLEDTLRGLRARTRNALALLPGPRPDWIVVGLSGTFPARTQRRTMFGIPLPGELGRTDRSLEELREDLDALADARWLKGVVFRLGVLHVSHATAYALREGIATVKRAGKRTVAFLTQLDWKHTYVASAADEVVAPESAEVALLGIGLSITFMRDALAKHGVRFEKLSIGEYKNAFDELVRQEMSQAQREQLEGLLASVEQHYVESLAQGRGMKPEAMKAFVDEGVTSAKRAREAGLIDRIAYEDEVVGERYVPLGAAARHLRVRRSSGGKRVAVVSLLGAIIPGRSRRSPAPIPVIGGLLAGAETLVQSLRAAGKDDRTAAVVFLVDSGGGSALASDLIGREVRRIAAKKPVVAVMGGVAASGGYYVLTHASRVIAAPTTVTGSIGVLTGKLVLEGLLQRHGLNHEQLRRGRFALLQDPGRPFTDEERALLARANEEIYRRFVDRVAEGRKMTTARVDALARGRVWSGLDALRLGLIDELGDVETAITRACELARIPRDAPVWNVKAPSELLLPTADDPTTVMRAVEPFLRETSWLLCPVASRVG